MKLIPDASRAWRLWSVRIAGLAVIIGALPVDQQAAILSLVGIGPERIPAVMGLAVIVARLCHQPGIEGHKDA